MKRWRNPRKSYNDKINSQVHDEPNFSVLLEERDRVQRIVIEEIAGAYLIQVPIQADCGWGKSARHEETLFQLHLTYPVKAPFLVIHQASISMQELLLWRLGDG